MALYHVCEHHPVVNKFFLFLLFFSSLISNTCESYLRSGMFVALEFTNLMYVDIVPFRRSDMCFWILSLTDRRLDV